LILTEMEVISVSAGEPPREILDALFWNYPALLRGSNAAQRFAAAMVGEDEPEEEIKEGESLGLWRAARAVAAERTHELEKAEALFNELIADENPWIALMGLLLRSWSESNSDTETIKATREAIASLDPEPEVRARLLAKVATFAFDKGAIDLGRECLADAIKLAPRGTALNQALRVEGLNARLKYEWLTEEPIPDPDPLVEYPWIEAMAQRAAQSALESQVEASGRGVWTNHFRMGRTPIDHAVSAEVQATWAGALWMRRPIRKQLGALLLGGGARTPQQWSYGVLMWALGGGTNPDSVFALAEPHLDPESADFIVRTLAESEISPALSSRLLSVTVEAWDEISDDLLRESIEAQPAPTDSEHPVANELRRLWAGYAARLNEEWLPQFEEFDTATQVALLEVLGTRTLSEFPSAAKQRVHEAIGRAIAENLDFGTQLLMIYATSAGTEQPDEEMRAAIAEKASPSTISRLAWAGHLELLNEEALKRAGEQLVNAVRQEAEEARKGTVSFGPEDVRLNLGRLIAATPSLNVNDEGTELLLGIATSSDLPGSHVLQSRMALTLIRKAEQLNRAQLAAMHEARDTSIGFDAFERASPALLEVSRLRVVATELSAEEVVALVSHCRSTEAKVRALALATCAEAVKEGPREGSEALAWSIVGGLFDPNDEVIEGVARGITLDFIRTHPAAGAVARSRFPALLDFGRMPVRATVRLRAKEWSENGDMEDDVTSDLLQRTSQDRSWIVRNV
jgi:hypothetical protein